MIEPINVRVIDCGTPNVALDSLSSDEEDENRLHPTDARPSSY